VKVRFGHKLLQGSLIVVAVWYLMHFAAGSKIIPSPHAAIAAFFRLLNEGILLHMAVSLYRICIALLCSALIGVPMGLWLGMNKKADALLSPAVYIMYPIPKAALLPVFMILLGLGDRSKIVLIVAVIVFQILIAARDGVKEITGDLLMSVRSLGLNHFQIYRHLIVPAALPRILSAMRISIGISISVLFFAETFATSYGIGYFIMNNWIMVNYVDMFAGILALSTMGILLFQGLDWLERKICPWVFINKD
jgi:NitT/TauT family transport system permease protein